MSHAIAHHAALDARMVAAARGLRLLSLASWPSQTQQAFLAAHAAGRRAMPVVDYPTLDFSETRRELEAVAGAADRDHPLGAYIIESAQAWGIAAQLLESLGTAAACGHAIACTDVRMSTCPAAR